MTKIYIYIYHEVPPPLPQKHEFCKASCTRGAPRCPLEPSIPAYIGGGHPRRGLPNPESFPRGPLQGLWSALPGGPAWKPCLESLPGGPSWRFCLEPCLMP